MDVIGIGNAIVDVICKVDETFLAQNKLKKGTMKLVEDNEFKNLLTSLKIEETISGGSVANTVVGLAQLGNKVGFIGKVNHDTLGMKYEEGLKNENVRYFYSPKQELLATGTCLILITPDSERTMCTYLGTAGRINERDINIDAIKKSKITLLEGYLWDKGDPQKAFELALKHSNKKAMSLSDQFCVERHKENFTDLVKNHLDIVFSNEQEINHLVGSNSINDVIHFAKELNKLIIVTRSEKGSLAIMGNEVFECASKKNLKLVDLTGAGDLFAAGFLNGYLKTQDIKSCLQEGTNLASQVIQILGARLEIKNN